MEARMTAANDSGAVEVLTLELDGEIFALDAACVREILDLVPITEVPGADPFARGLINVRGRVVPFADLRIRFGMDLTEPTIDTRIVVIEIDIEGEAVTVGILADKVLEVTALPKASLSETPQIGMRWRPEFIRCIGKHGADFIVVLDIERLFSNGTDDRAGSSEGGVAVPAGSPASAGVV